MVGRVEDKVNESGEGGEQELESDARIQTTAVKWSGRSQRESVGQDGNEGGIG